MDPSTLRANRIGLQRRIGSHRARDCEECQADKASWDEIDLSVDIYSCRGLSRDELTDILLEEKNIRNCDILGLCETRRKKEPHRKWKEGSMVLLGSGSGQQAVGGIGLLSIKSGQTRSWNATSSPRQLAFSFS
ncbi:hypothetical protein AB6A40_000202 [Gnathostoma spinigerum]|uniref:Uncharacterized protein n=1 Tax=Gnathostoma spinigerum TaxID=75299 RepID=A0ABD6E1N9_9BILA